MLEDKEIMVKKIQTMRRDLVAWHEAFEGHQSDYESQLRRLQDEMFLEFRDIKTRILQARTRIRAALEAVGELPGQPTQIVETSPP